MARNSVRNTTLSLDTISIIKRLYPRLQSFWENHLKETDVTIQGFYGAMRNDPISVETDQLIESNLDYDLRKIGVDRDDVAVIPEVTAESLIPELLEHMEFEIGHMIDEPAIKLLMKLRLLAFSLANSHELGR